MAAREESLERREPPRVVVIGGGFGGLNAARTLKRAPVQVVVLDRRNHHLFQPLLYQVATAALSPGDISAPIRHVLHRQQNAEVVLGEVAAVDTEHHRVVLADGAELEYDFLVVATGATHSYFGHDEWEAIAPGLKTLEDAVEIRRRVLLAFEQAEREEDEGRRRELMSFVIIGGGPTGVELAGALSEIARHTLMADFRRIKPESARVVLLEAAPRVLPAYPEKLSGDAKLQLEELGVEVRVGTRVTGVDEGGVSIGAERIEAATVLWAAGVEASPLARTLGTPLDRAGRVRVEPDLTIPGHPEVFVIGDLAAVDQGGGRGLVPGLAPAAIQEGRYAARAIVRTLRGEARPPFRYRDKGILATIGRAAAVARIGRVLFSGLLAWLAWLTIHIYFLIGFRNRVAVILQWAWSYVTFQRGARLITETAEQWRVVAERSEARLRGATVKAGRGEAARAESGADDARLAAEDGRPPAVH